MCRPTVLPAGDEDGLPAHQGVGHLGPAAFQHAADRLTGHTEGLGRLLVAEAFQIDEPYGFQLVDGELSPSSDTAAHAYVYRHMPKVGGVVHTHSTYATAWAARGEPIPCVLTMIADEFGGDVPVGPFALIGDDSIGRGIVETLRDSSSPAVLMRNHGPFTIGRTARDAVKAAVMVEDVARTVHISRQLGTPSPIAAADVGALFERYQNVYGQPDRRPEDPQETQR